MSDVPKPAWVFLPPATLVATTIVLAVALGVELWLLYWAILGGAGAACTVWLTEPVHWPGATTAMVTILALMAVTLGTLSALARIGRQE
ncbi:MAG: hypothetical protein V2A73_16215 [Pseudomonadota bacterium]